MTFVYDDLKNKLTHTTDSEDKMAQTILHRCLPPERIQSDVNAITQDILRILDTDDTHTDRKTRLSRQTKLLDALFMRLLSSGISTQGYLDNDILKLALQAQKYARLSLQSLHVMDEDQGGNGISASNQAMIKNAQSELSNMEIYNDYNGL